MALAIALASLAAAGHHAREDLFYLYALLPLAVSFVAEQLRALSAQAVLDQRGLQGAAEVGTLPESEQQLVVGDVLRRELGVMTISASCRGAGTACGRDRPRILSGRWAGSGRHGIPGPAVDIFPAHEVRRDHGPTGVRRALGAADPRGSSWTRPVPTTRVP